MKAYRNFKSITFSVILSFLITNEVSGQDFSKSDDTLHITIKSYDGLTLPAQVIKADNHDKKLILFINGSTPYDEKGNLGAFWNNEGKIVTQKQDFYLRFLEIMSSKGYSVATMAKRSFIYPTVIPRPNFSDLALDIYYLILKLKQDNYIENEKDLVIIGYSEGSIVATKVLSLMKTQPYACILLGSGSSECNYYKVSVDEYHNTDVLRRTKNMTDEQIQKEMDHFAQINKSLRTIDEKKFENEYKKSAGFAMWESYYIDKETPLYSPVPNIVYANIPLLICVGEDDRAMSMVQAKKTYDSLLEHQFKKATFKVIEKEGHQYKKYDVFAIIDTWLSSEFQTTDYMLTRSDSLMIQKYAKANKVLKKLSAIPNGGGHPDRIISCYNEAVEIGMVDEINWYYLGLKLFADGFNEKAYHAFSKASKGNFAVRYISWVWMGHINDLQNQRKEAITFYQKALDTYPGFPFKHDNWNIVIDNKWLEERIKIPFKGIKE